MLLSPQFDLNEMPIMITSSAEAQTPGVLEISDLVGSGYRGCSSIEDSKIKILGEYKKLMDTTGIFALATDFLDPRRLLLIRISLI